jgi:hypothetical protein
MCAACHLAAASKGEDSSGSSAPPRPAPIGRFNQRHLASHRMRLVPRQLTTLHIFQAANPQVPMAQLMWMLELARGREQGDSELDEAEEEEQNQGGDGEEGQAAAATTGEGAEPLVAQEAMGGRAFEDASSRGEVSGAPGRSLEDRREERREEGGGIAVGVEDEEDTPIPTLRRGPRPAVVPGSVWPSPSAPPGAGE